MKLAEIQDPILTFNKEESNASSRETRERLKQKGRKSMLSYLVKQKSKNNNPHSPDDDNARWDDGDVNLPGKSSFDTIS